MPNRFSEQALRESQAFGVRAIPLLRPLGWLARGWRDLWHAPLVSLAQGAVMAAFGALLWWLAHERFWLLSGAFSGFLLVAPVLATGFYACSRELDRGGKPGWHTVREAWLPRDGRLVVFGVLLAFAGTGWVMCSASLVAGFTPAPVRTPRDFLVHVVLNDASPLFELWLALGAVLAAPVFASTVVAIPALLDQPQNRLGVYGAVLTSWRVVLEHPAPIALWAALLMLLTLVGMATALVGLVVILPWLGHASWHAYRDLVTRRHD
ncbi:DUF2189 domain-containing protein [Roseateles cellulosilyticus]|uniref:DUF2189 domain-containing protein n=1 Tax=Pelomonas cellulosilytica TaxID=2906762 RepID=A0ABS8XVX7_9BURK|nr:DUF2189 domain-containing protein [Pelomonas sp. P8]MCE4555363.1 DUF2189 domain-containing protein [Pelomonas sp. P8]